MSAVFPHPEIAPQRPNWLRSSSAGRGVPKIVHLPAARERGRAVLDTDVHHDASSFGLPSPDVAERASRLVLYDALSHEAMSALTTGVFLVGFAVALGASNFAIGVLAAVPFLAQLLQIPAVLLIERWRARRS